MQSVSRPRVRGFMEIQPVNLNEIVGVTLGMLVVLIPIMGATVRFAARPLVEALLQAGVIGPRTQAATDSELGRLSRRVLELEQELQRRKLEAFAPLGAEPSRAERSSCSAAEGDRGGQVSREEPARGVEPVQLGKRPTLLYTDASRNLMLPVP